MADLDTTMVLDDLTWRAPVLALAPRPVPQFAEPPPDAEAVRRRISQEAQEAQQRLQGEQQIARRLRKMRTAGVVTLALGLAPLVAFAVGPVEVAAVLLVASSIAAAVAFASYRRARDPLAGPVFLPAAGILLVSCCTVGVVPVGLGLSMLLSTPTFRWTDSSLSRLDQNVLGSVRQRQEVVAGLQDLIADPRARCDAELTRMYAAHAAARAEYDQRHASMPRFDPIPPRPEADLLCIGGSRVERAEVVHHLVGSLSQAGPVWVIDLSPNGSLAKVIAWASRWGDASGILDASDDASLHWHIDRLYQLQDDRRSLMVDVLIDALASPGGDTAGAGRRDVADTLQRIVEVLDACDQELSLTVLHESIQVLLAGARRSATSDGSADVAPAPVSRAGLDPFAVEALRLEFTDDERREHLRGWSDIRRKLQALRAARGTESEPDRPWRPGALVNLAFVGGSLAIDDLQLRRALLVGIGRNLLRADGGRRVRSVVIAGADHLEAQEVLDLSSLAEASGVTLVSMFAELTSTARQLARGRRSLVVLGGLGSEAAEELSAMLGMDWTERAQWYQSTWSDAESESRAETSGRSWSTTSPDGRTRTWGSSSSEHGGTPNRSREGTTSTGITEGVEISNLAPFTALLRHAARCTSSTSTGRSPWSPRSRRLPLSSCWGGGPPAGVARPAEISACAPSGGAVRTTSGWRGDAGSASPTPVRLVAGHWRVMTVVGPAPSQLRPSASTDRISTSTRLTPLHQS